MKSLEQSAARVCRDLRSKGNYRVERDSAAGIRLNLASNDYMGVVRRGLLKDSVARHAGVCASGGAAARLVFGTTRTHRALEERLAEYFGYESALVFTSGFMANYGLFSALKEISETVLIDKRVHASVVDGLMQSLGGKAEVRSFKHNDVGHMRQLAGRVDNSKLVVVTESLFSMTGRLCPGELIREGSRLGFMVVDEAHSLGACSEGGKAIFGRPAGVDITIGTFGKAFGCAGGFILSSAVMREFLVNRCRSFIFTTALPELYAAVALDAIDIVAGMQEERQHLSRLARCLSGQLRSAGFRITGDAHIIALYCSGAEESLEVSRLLWQDGIALYGVRPPTVPPREILLRISLNATLTMEEMETVFEKLVRIRSDSPHLFQSGSASVSN